MMNLCIKFEVSVFTYYEDMKSNEKRRNCGCLGEVRWEHIHSIQGL